MAFTTLNEDVGINCSQDGIIGSILTTNVPPKPIADPIMPLFRFVCEVAISLPVAIFGIFGNVLAFVVLCQQKKRLTTSVLLQILAVVDTLILISSILLRSMRYVNWSAYDGQYHYVFMSLYPCVYFLRLADTWITVLMTVDRYIAVSHPLKAQRLCTLRRTYAIVGVIFLMTFVFSTPRFFEFRLTERRSPATIGFVHTELVLDRTYTLLYRIASFFVVMYLVPMMTLMVLNIRLLTTVRRANRNRDSMLSEANSTDNDQSHDVRTSARNVTVIVVAVVVVCLSCNTITMTTHVIWAIQMCFRDLRYLERYRRFLANVSNVMVTLNSAVNFVIYCLFSRKFRSEVKAIFRTGKLRRLSCKRWRDSAGDDDCSASMASRHTISSTQI